VETASYINCPTVRREWNWLNITHGGIAGEGGREEKYRDEQTGKKMT